MLSENLLPDIVLPVLMLGPSQASEKFPMAEGVLYSFVLSAVQRHCQALT